MLLFEEQVEAKRRELLTLKKITVLTDNMKLQLDELASQVQQMNSNATSVSKVMENWNSISRSISLAGLSLLQYAEGDYEVGAWEKDINDDKNIKNDNNYNSKANNNNNKDEKEQDNQCGPLPETLVRIRMDEEN